MMKSSSILAFFLLFYTTAITQEVNLYGFYNNGNPGADFLSLAKVGPSTGSIVDVDSIFNIYGYAVGSSSFDQVNQYYNFLGVDSNSFMRFVLWDVMEDTITSQAQVFETVNDIQYDMNSTEYYGMGNYLLDTVFYQYASRLVTINVESGALTEIAKIPELRTFPIGGSTFDANGGRYIVNGTDSLYQECIFIIEASTGIVLSAEPLNLGSGEYLNELEYNNVDDKLYGFFRNNSSGVKALVSVDISTNAMDTIAFLNQVYAFVQGASVFHQQTQLFILYYIDFSGNKNLISIDVTTGNVVSDVSLSEHLTELEVDNNEFAMQAYHSTTAVSATIKKAAISVYPNPAHNFITIWSDTPIHTAALTDLTGKELLRVSQVDQKSCRIELPDLPVGSYLLRVEMGEQSVIRKVLIR